MKASVQRIADTGPSPSRWPKWPPATTRHSASSRRSRWNTRSATSRSVPARDGPAIYHVGHAVRAARRPGLPEGRRTTVHRGPRRRPVRRATGLRPDAARAAPAVAKPLEIAGPWELRFPPRSSAPESVALESLISWTQHKDDGVKYFSGTATYVKEFDVPAELIGQGKVLWLDLGKCCACSPR